MARGGDSRRQTFPGQRSRGHAGLGWARTLVAVAGRNDLADANTDTRPELKRAEQTDREDARPRDHGHERHNCL